jgi:TonB family protein
MYFDFEDYRPDITPVGRAISAREGVLISIILHLVAVIAIMVLPALLPETVQPIAQAPPERPEDRTRFVFVQPRNDERALRPPNRAELSDQDRQARSRERAPQPTNPLPFSRGNTPERVERAEQAESRGDPRQPESQQALAEPVPPAADTPRLPESPSALQLPSNRQPQSAPRFSGNSLNDALRNLQRYIQADQFENQRGGSMFGPAIQFDTKGVEFGPWVRRFVAQVKRNWEPLIPLAVMTMRGHVVITFNVHKSGAITDLAIVKPAPIEAFDTAAYGALVSSNPTQPLPPEYPADKAFFTVTFFYNEEPQ